jgi:hypothetical protein
MDQRTQRLLLEKTLDIAVDKILEAEKQLDDVCFLFFLSFFCLFVIFDLILPYLTLKFGLLPCIFPPLLGN